MKITLKNVSKTIKGCLILDDINLEMESGNVYGLRGSNGSGKTMLMRAIAGLIRVEGTVKLDDKILGKDISFPESLGIMIENPAFIEDYTAFRNLFLLAMIKGTATKEDIRNALERVGLDPDDRRTYRKFSLGMKQRLGIACAIMEKPEILILDEPVNALDEDGIALVHDILEEERRRGALIIIACHDKEEMNALANKFFIVSEGKVRSDDNVYVHIN